MFGCACVCVFVCVSVCLGVCVVSLVRGVFMFWVVFYPAGLVRLLRTSRALC